jgi:hypothetical protein
MEFKDLDTKKDVKGGDPRASSDSQTKGRKTPVPLPLQKYMDAQPANGPTVWRTIALIEASILISGIAGWFTFGFDSVKHSEIDILMATRAPYIHDKQRIWDRFESQDQRIIENTKRTTSLENQLSGIVPDVREIKTKLDDLTSLLKNDGKK